MTLRNLLTNLLILSYLCGDLVQDYLYSNFDLWGYVVSHYLSSDDDTIKLPLRKIEYLNQYAYQ